MVSDMARTSGKERRGYGQYCAVAKALDVIGDRWTLLIVRELLLRGGCRYTDLRAGLPGIATNLLVARLRELEDTGIVEREQAPPPVATTLFKLTPRGEGLRDVVHAIGRWGGALLREASPGDAFCSHWIAMPLELHLVDNAPDRRPVTIEIRAGDQPATPVTIEASGTVRIRHGRAERPDAIVSGPPPAVLGLLTGKTTLAQARRHGVRFEGSAAALRRVQPR
jgi:DNA-binding HxlR family transcriptional regulator